MNGSHEQEHEHACAAVDRPSWFALVPLSLAMLMPAMNATAVSVALPSISLDLQFSGNSLAWVITAYLATYGAFLLLGGGFGDLFGRRRLFLLGISCFAVASIGCGLATSLGALLAGRLLQGLGAAIVVAVVLSQIMILFNNSPQRGRALGVYFLVGAGGGAIGLFLGGFLTTVLGWEGVFFANVPIGVVAYVTGIALLPPDVQETRHGRIDIAGALAVSSSLIVALYAILDASRAGWISGQTLGLLVAAGLLVTLFARIEARASAPLMPMQLFKIRNFSIVVIAAALLAAALLACSFISALYLQIVLGSSPYEVGLALLPTNLTMAAMSLLILPSLVVRFGSRLPLLTGMVLVTLGLALLGRARIGGTVIVDVLPGMLLVGIGAGMANPPIYTTAFRDVPPSSFGAASGILNTACVMGAALGLSVVASIAAIRTNTLLVAGATPTSALHGGYRAGFYVSAGFTILASLMSGMLLHDRKQP